MYTVANLGKGESIWDRFVHSTPGRIKNNATGDVADNSYYQYTDDIDILKNLGVINDHLSFRDLHFLA